MQRGLMAYARGLSGSELVNLQDCCHDII